MSAAPPLKTVSQILVDLRKDTKSDWVVIPDVYGLTVPAIGPRGVINYLDAKKGIVLTAFFNTATAEVRFYLAKYLDIPDRERLL